MSTRRQLIIFRRQRELAEALSLDTAAEDRMRLAARVIRQACGLDPCGELPEVHAMHDRLRVDGVARVMRYWRASQYHLYNDRRPAIARAIDEDPEFGARCKRIRLCLSPGASYRCGNDKFCPLCFGSAMYRDFATLTDSLERAPYRTPVTMVKLTYTHDPETSGPFDEWCATTRKSAMLRKAIPTLKRDLERADWKTTSTVSWFDVTEDGRAQLVILHAVHARTRDLVPCTLPGVGVQVYDALHTPGHVADVLIQEARFPAAALSNHPGVLPTLMSVRTRAWYRSTGLLDYA